MINIQNLYDWAKTNNCLDYSLSVLDTNVTLKSLVKDNDEKTVKLDITPSLQQCFELIIRMPGAHADIWETLEKLIEEKNK